MRTAKNVPSGRVTRRKPPVPAMGSEVTFTPHSEEDVRKVEYEMRELNFPRLSDHMRWRLGCRSIVRQRCRRQMHQVAMLRGKLSLIDTCLCNRARAEQRYCAALQRNKSSAGSRVKKWTGTEEGENWNR